MEKEVLVRITSDYFCAGIVFKDDYVCETAPILKWSKNRSFFWMKKYCEKKKWKFEKL
jgi:hypothetical protein